MVSVNRNAGSAPYREPPLPSKRDPGCRNHFGQLCSYLKVVIGPGIHMVRLLRQGGWADDFHRAAP